MKNMDKILLISTFLLSIFGLMMIYSSSSIWANYKFQDSFHFLKYQLFFLLIGFILMIITSFIPVDIYKEQSNMIFLFSFILLVLVLIPGIGSIRNGSRSWFGIGSFGIQPSEAAKICLLIFNIKTYRTGIFPILFISFLFFSLIMLQPDLGTGFIMILSIISLLFVAGSDMKFFVGGGILGVIGIIVLIIIAPYRLNRITSFLNPWKDPLGTGFQSIQSLYAIAPSGLLGRGYLNSIQKHFYLPEPQTDFIFAIILEEFGIIGAILVVGLFSIILYRGIKIAIRQTDSFKKYLSFGIVFQILFQASLNLMVVVGLIPITGVTLPFLSYGGSSLLISLISIGILLNISKSSI